MGGESVIVGFTMLPSYYDAIRPLPDNQRHALFDAIMDYAFRGIEPEGLEPILQGYFRLLRPNIDSSIRTYSASVFNGKKGGRPKKEAEKKPEETQKKPSGKRDKDKEKDKDRDKDRENMKADKPPRPHFVPPTLAEVQLYVAERHSPVDPQGFIDFYEAKGWMVGKTPMKDWKAACRNAENWDRWKKKSDPGGRVIDYENCDKSWSL